MTHARADRGHSPVAAERLARMRGAGGMAIGALFAVAAAVAAGAAVTNGGSRTVAGITAMAIGLVIVATRPQLAIALWLFGMVAAGHTITHISVAGGGGTPVYVTELVFGVLALGIVIRWAMGDDVTSPPWLVWSTVGVAMVAGLLALGAATTLGNPAWVRNFALVYYFGIAILVGAFVPTRQWIRWLFLAVVVGAIVAWVSVATGVDTGGVTNKITSTGAIRVAHPSYTLPFGVGPLMLLAAGLEGQVRKVWLALIPVLLVGLVAVNYRSSWIALAAGLTVILASRGKRVIAAAGAAVVLSAVLVAGWSLLTSDQTVALEVKRATTVTDSTDPTAHFRLTYWGNIVRAMERHPLQGAGFDDYGAEVKPPIVRQVVNGQDSTWKEPHNSFLALAYRIGVVPGGVVIGLLALLLAQGWRCSRRDEEPFWRATTMGLTASIVFVAVYSAFNVGLETPYTASPFWIAVGVLATVLRMRRHTSTPGV